MERTLRREGWKGERAEVARSFRMRIRSAIFCAMGVSIATAALAAEEGRMLLIDLDPRMQPGRHSPQASNSRAFQPLSAASPL